MQPPGVVGSQAPLRHGLLDRASQAASVPRAVRQEMFRAYVVFGNRGSARLAGPTRGSSMAERTVKALEYLVFAVGYVLATVLVGIVFPLRMSGKRSVPRGGGALVISNHQSFLDPIILGLALGRRSCFVARSSLFRFALFRGLITALGAIRINREGIGKSGLQEALLKLAAGRTVVLWPEGTRTADGSLGRLHPGVLVLVRRAQVPVVVAGVAGAFESWPRHQPIPRRTPLWVHFERWNLQGEETEEMLDSLRGALQTAVLHAERCRRQAIRASHHPGK
jgi:1-acyl-sn-glycerol-3-phosphate acyltransferase